MMVGALPRMDIAVIKKWQAATGHQRLPFWAEPTSCIPIASCGNSFPLKPIGAARATEWECGGSLPPP